VKVLTLGALYEMKLRICVAKQMYFDSDIKACSFVNYYFWKRWW